MLLPAIMAIVSFSAFMNFKYHNFIPNKIQFLIIQPVNQTMEPVIHDQTFTKKLPVEITEKWEMDLTIDFAWPLACNSGSFHSWSCPQHMGKLVPCSSIFRPKDCLN